MKKVICISIARNKGFDPLPLTIGEMYDVIKEAFIPFSPSRYDEPIGPFYKIKCDTGEVRHFQAYRFRDLTIDEKRELKLNDIGI